MDTIINYLSQLTSIVDIIKNDYAEYSQKLSRLDLEAEDILHILENQPFDAEQGYQLALRLQDIRCRRRAVKNRLEQLQIIISNVHCTDFEKVRKKVEKKAQQQSEGTYTPKVMVLEESDSLPEIDEGNN